MTLALMEGRWLKKFLKETTMFLDHLLLLRCDNILAIMLAKNLKHSGITKNIAMKLQFTRELLHEVIDPVVKYRDGRDEVISLSIVLGVDRNSSRSTNTSERGI